MGVQHYLSMSHKPPVTLRDLYPDLPDEILAEIEDVFDRYLTLVWRIQQRLEHMASEVGCDQKSEAEALPPVLEK